MMAPILLRVGSLSGQLRGTSYFNILYVKNIYIYANINIILAHTLLFILPVVLTAMYSARELSEILNRNRRKGRIGKYGG